MAAEVTPAETAKQLCDDANDRLFTLEDEGGDLDPAELANICGVFQNALKIDPNNIEVHLHYTHAASAVVFQL
jgi:hypothetical protein